MNLINFVCLPLLLHASAQIADAPAGKIGIRIGVFSHRIQRVFHNTPAERVGLKEGDKVLVTFDKLDSHDIAGPAGTDVVLTVRRGDKDLIFIVKRVPETEIVRK